MNTVGISQASKSYVVDDLFSDMASLDDIDWGAVDGLLASLHRGAVKP